MNLRVKISLLFLISLILVSNNFAQGISRSTGLGLRASIWKTKNQKNDDYYQGGVVSSDGGGSIYFFSRVTGKLFLETSIGGNAKTRIGGGVESRTLIPFLFGLRYDLLSSRYGSSYQPYLALGAGSYFIQYSLIRGSVITESDAEFGIFVGGGMNVVLKTWFALNCDIKYHLVNLNNTAVDDFSSLQFSMGCSFMWGRKQEIFRIKEVKVVVKDIYPAYYQFYSSYPLALVTVQNTVSYPIEVNVRSNVKEYSERSQESGFVQIDRGETTDIPVHALFGPKLLQSSRRVPAVLDIELESRAGAVLTKTTSAQVIIHNRNAWNGEIDRLGFFVTPDDKHILEISRKVMNQISNIYKDETNNFVMAKALFNELTNLKIRYQSDPNIPFYKDDRVQFANETIELGTGDCDDLVVLYSSLLESVGLKTAFVDVYDPEKEIAHVYLIFDSGLSPDQSRLISSNEKRFIVREKSANNQTLWIPVETTLLEAGFDEAWKSGALQYLQEGILRDGIDRGWVKIIDVEQISSKY